MTLKVIMKKKLTCPIDGGINISRISNSFGVFGEKKIQEYKCRGCGFIFTLDTIGRLKEEIKPIYVEVEVEPEPEPEPKITKCSNCDWTTTEVVKICENCGIEIKNK